MPPDAAEHTDAAIDALPITCDYNEKNDTTNDTVFGFGIAEPSSVSLTATSTICGKLDAGHFDAGRQNTDVDSFVISVPAASPVLVYLSGAGVETFGSVRLAIRGVNNTVDERGVFVGSLAVTSAVLPAGQYEITVASFNSAAAMSAVPYKVTVMVDAPGRCGKAAAPANYTEAHESTMPGKGGDNDVIEVVYGASRVATATQKADAPEDTGITVQADMKYRITGDSGTFQPSPQSWGDSLMDREVYEVKMGPVTNQLSLRLNWIGSTADFDVLVFPAGFFGELGAAVKVANSDDEFFTMATATSGSYWILVAAKDGATGQPIPYDLTLCGSAVQP